MEIKMTSGQAQGRTLAREVARAQALVTSEVTSVIHWLVADDRRVSYLGTKHVSAEVKRRIDSMDPHQLASIFLGTSERTMYECGNGTISNQWGWGDKYSQPADFLCAAAHALLCQQVGKKLIELGYFFDSDP